MMKLSLVFVLSASLTASANPIFGDVYHREKFQNVLSKNIDNHHHPVLDKYINDGLFNRIDVNNQISQAWELLENTVSSSEIEDALKEFNSEFLTYEAPKSAVRVPDLPDTLNYDHIKSNEFESYGLRIKKHTDSDPSILGIDIVKQWTGYFDINEADKHLFFWFFESRNDPSNDPVILWLNGGPGCSSMTGLFFELGPSSINGTTLKPVYNPYSWNSNASIIFLEQPVGVGYSYAEKSSVSSTQQAAEDVYAFLQLFFSKFITFADNDFHIAGESYAGHYIPNIASVILSKKDRYFDLTSVMIGNGITDSLIQYYYYIPMACNATESGYKQLISDDDCDKMEDMYTGCASLINNCYQSQTALTCLPAYLYCERMMGPFEKTGLNYYDIRKPCLGDGCYPQMSAIDEYLNLPEVMQALGSEVKEYVGCDNKVFRKFIFSGDEPKPFQQFIAEILEFDIPVLLYSGDKDYICNWLGNKGWSNELPWSGKDSFTNASVTDWYSKINGEHAGTVQSNGLLTFLRVFDAGHMVPFDQPSNSLDMVNRWMNGDYYFAKQ